MLKIWIGEKLDENYITSDSFEAFYEDEWFDDPRVKQIIKDIDKSDAESFGRIDSPFLGPITYRDLSSGSRLLIMMIFLPEYDYNSVFFGDNCTPWIVEIAKGQDVSLVMESSMLFPDEMEALIVNTGEVITSGTKLIHKYAELS